MTDYTPTTETVAHYYAVGRGLGDPNVYRFDLESFNRWFATEIAKAEQRGYEKGCADERAKAAAAMLPVLWKGNYKGGLSRVLDDAIVAARADEREKVGASMAALMRKHPHEYPSDYADMTERMIADGSIHDAARGGEQGLPRQASARATPTNSTSPSTSLSRAGSVQSAARPVQPWTVATSTASGAAPSKPRTRSATTSPATSASWRLRWRTRRPTPACAS